MHRDVVGRRLSHFWCCKQTPEGRLGVWYPVHIQAVTKDTGKLQVGEAGLLILNHSSLHVAQA